MLKDVLALLPPHARLAFVGDGPARPELEAHFHGTRTVFTGMLRGRDLGAAYASADIFVMPSATETLGFVALEAMASGLPALCAAAGGLADIVVRPGEVGFLLPPDDPAAWAAQARALIHDPAARSAVGGAARACVEGKGWAPAVAVVRDRQYRRAVRAHARAIKRRACARHSQALACRQPPELARHGPSEALVVEPPAADFGGRCVRTRSGVEQRGWRAHGLGLWQPAGGLVVAG
jgi:hypothetical protein